MGDSQHHPTTILADCIVLNAAELATVIGPLKDACTDLLPVLRVSGFIFWFNWHIADGDGLEPPTSGFTGTLPSELPIQNAAVSALLGNCAVVKE